MVPEKKDKSDLIFIGQRVKLIREKAKLSQTQFAQTLGISQSRLSDLEAGKRGPDHGILMNLKKAMKTETDYILTGKGAAIQSNKQPLSDINDLLSEQETDRSIIKRLTVQMKELQKRVEKLEIQVKINEFNTSE